MATPLRLAIVSTPRAGNTWLRSLLTRYYAIPTTCSHALSDGDFAAMPAEVIHQIHWRRTPEFVKQLQRHGFRALSMARHPLDTLISILHFAWYDRETTNWLGGEGGDETSLCGASPRSRAFIEYATGPRAKALLAVTAEWWQQPGVVSMRYEDLVRETAAELAGMAKSFGPPRCASVASVIADCSLDHLRVDSINNHFWKGQPGLWRVLLTAADAAEIAAAHAPLIKRLGYTASGDRALTASAADRNWISMIGPELTKSLARNTAGHRTQIERAEARMKGFEQEALAARTAAQAADLARLEAERLQAETQRRLDAALAELQPFRRLQGFSVATAERIQGWRERHPRTSGAVKSVFRRVNPA